MEDVVNFGGSVRNQPRKHEPGAGLSVGVQSASDLVVDGLRVDGCAGDVGVERARELLARRAAVRADRPECG